jgi:hypothetical protein
LTYTVRAKTYEGGAWRECVLYIKADDGLMPTGGSELAYSTQWNTPNTGPYQNSNCYTYALGFYTNQFGGADPGYFSGMGAWPNSEMNEANWKTRVEADMMYMFNTSNISSVWKPISEFEIPGNYGYRVAGYIHNDQSDNFKAYHFYRQDTYGYWSHKLPNNPSMNVDGSGNAISDPEDCDRTVATTYYETWAQSTNYYYAFYSVVW